MRFKEGDCVKALPSAPYSHTVAGNGYGVVMEESGGDVVLTWYFLNGTELTFTGEERWFVKADEMLAEVLTVEILDERPEKMKRKVWEVVKDVIRSRIAKGSDALPWCVKDVCVGAKVLHLKEDGEEIDCVLVLRTNGRILLYHGCGGQFIRDRCRGLVAEKLYGLQKDIEQVIGKFFWLRFDSCSEEEYVLKYGFEQNLEEFRVWWSESAVGMQRVNLFRAYRDFMKRKWMRESVVFTGDQILEELKKHPKVEKASKRFSTWTVETKPLSVPIDKASGTVLELGRYMIRVSLRKDGKCGFVLTRREGAMRVQRQYYLSAYIKVARQDRKSVTQESPHVCLGNNADLFNSAIDVGDVYSVFDQLLQLVNQPDYESNGPYMKWKDIARVVHWEWDWCPSCAELRKAGCSCVNCLCSGKERPHLVRLGSLCKRCGYCAGSCVCVPCEMCADGKVKSAACVAVQLHGGEGEDVQRMRNEVNVCFEHATKEVVEKLRAIYNGPEGWNGVQGWLRGHRQEMKRVEAIENQDEVVSRRFSSVPEDVENLLASLSGQEPAQIILEDELWQPGDEEQDDYHGEEEEEEQN
jgi:hypothetical protein